MVAEQLVHGSKARQWRNVTFHCRQLRLEKGVQHRSLRSRSQNASSKSYVKNFRICAIAKTAKIDVKMKLNATFVTWIFKCMTFAPSSLR